MSRKSENILLAAMQRVAELVMFVGAPVAAVTFVYLAYVYLGPGKSLGSMPAANAYNFRQGIWIAEQAFMISAIAVCVAAVVEYFHEETTGLLLLVGGAILYFGMPYTLLYLDGRSIGVIDPAGKSILKAYGVAGLVAMVPGVLMFIRDTVLMIRLRIRTSTRETKNISAKERREHQGKRIRALPKCWDIAFCSEYVKKVCPAWRTRKPCWHLRTGCYCEEYAILKLVPGSKENAEAAEMAKAVADGVRKPTKAPMLQLSNRQKVERCRKCNIYLEHQRQKFRVMGVFVFPVVAAILYFSYGSVAKLSYAGLANSDRYFAMFIPGSKVSNNLMGDVGVVTIVSMIVLGIILLVSTLRLLEYLIFELQV